MVVPAGRVLLVATAFVGEVGAASPAGSAVVLLPHADVVTSTSATNTSRVLMV